MEKQRESEGSEPYAELKKSRLYIAFTNCLREVKNAIGRAYPITDEDTAGKREKCEKMVRNVVRGRSMREIDDTGLAKEVLETINALNLFVKEHNDAMPRLLRAISGLPDDRRIASSLENLSTDAIKELISGSGIGLNMSELRLELERRELERRELEERRKNDHDMYMHDLGEKINSMLGQLPEEFNNLKEKVYDILVDIKASPVISFKTRVLFIDDILPKFRDNERDVFNRFIPLLKKYHMLHVKRTIDNSHRNATQKVQLEKKLLRELADDREEPEELDGSL